MISPHLAPMLSIDNRMEASLASLLISAQELLYAVKVVSIDSLLTTLSSNNANKLLMALYSPADAAIVQCFTARSKFPDS